MTTFRRNNQQGLTLIEMMIAMILGILVTGTILTVFISNVKSATENVKMIRLNQELRVVMGFVSDELKRAGYSADPDNEEFINQLSVPVAPDNDCVIYSYDVNANGLRNAAEENFGFRLENQQIQWGRNVSCTGSSGWQSLTFLENSRITNFTILPPPTPLTNGGITIQQYEVTITGETNLNPGTASRTISEVIRIRNDDLS